MRSRADIQRDINATGQAGNKIVVEVLLDIRDKLDDQLTVQKLGEIADSIKTIHEEMSS